MIAFKAGFLDAQHGRDRKLGGNYTMGQDCYKSFRTGPDGEVIGADAFTRGYREGQSPLADVAASLKNTTCLRDPDFVIGYECGLEYGHEVTVAASNNQFRAGFELGLRARNLK